MNQGDIIGKSKEAVFKSDMASFKEELRNNILQAQARFEIGNRSEVNATEFDAQGDGTGIKDWIPSVTEGYRGKLEIEGGELKYVGEDTTEIAWATAMTMYGEDVDISQPLPQDAIATYPEIEIGDYVEYTVDSFPYARIADQNLEKEDLNWRVLKNDGINVTLISDAPTTNTIRFSGKENWVNALEQLNMGCGLLYSSNIGIARSLNVDDVNSITRFDGDDETNWKYSNASGSIVSVPSNVRTIGELEASVGSSLTYIQTPEIGKSLESYAPNYYNYSGIDTLSSSSMEYKLLFRNVADTNYAPNYWLGTSCVQPLFIARCASFDIRSVESGRVEAITMYDSYDQSGTGAYCAVQPIVILYSSVKVDIIEGRDGTTPEKAWKIKSMEL